MATPTENWVYDKNIVTEKDRKALEKAKKVAEAFNDFDAPEGEKDNK